MPKFKTKTAAICYAFLQGESITIMDGFKKYLVTNLPREVGRSVERAFDVKLTRTKKDYISITGLSGYYFEYKLESLEENKEGIKKMWDYVRQNIHGADTMINPKIVEESKWKQTAMF